MILPIPIAPINIVEPRKPIIMLSTNPTKGIVIFDSISGNAIRRTL